MSWKPETLLESSVYPHSVLEPVELIETHISWVFLAGHFAYKIKKPIVNEFLDYGTLEKRHAACIQEVNLVNDSHQSFTSMLCRSLQSKGNAESMATRIRSISQYA